MVTSQPSITNCPKLSFLLKIYTFSILNLEDLFFLICMICYNVIQVTIARRFHLFPFRTEKLSFVTPMVLLISGRVGSRRFSQSPQYRQMLGTFFCCSATLYWHSFSLIYIKHTRAEISQKIWCSIRNTLSNEISLNFNALTDTLCWKGF